MKATKLPSGNYRIRVFVGEEYGKKKFISLTGTDPKRLKAKAEALADEIRTSKIPDNITVREAVTRYIKSRQNVVSPSTIVGYECELNNHLSLLLDIKLFKLTNEHIQLQINQLMKEGLSPKTIKNAMGLLKPAIKLFYPTFVFVLTMPKEQKIKKTIPSSAMLKSMLNYAKGTDLELAIILASFSMRRSEICALTSDDVYDDRIEINKATVLNTKNQYVIKSTKNYLIRTIELPKEVIIKLKQKEGKIVKYNPCELSERFKTLQKHCNFYGGIHSLRHYFASVLHALGVPDQYIAERGGWANVKTLQNIYQHAMTEQEKEINEKVHDFYNKNLL